MNYALWWPNHCGVQDVIPVSLPVRTCIKRKVYSNTAPGLREDVNNHCLSCVITVGSPLPAGLPGQCHLSEG